MLKENNNLISITIGSEHQHADVIVFFLLISFV